MKLMIAAVLLVGLAASAPTTTSEGSTEVAIDKDFFPAELSVYRSQHDIVDLVVPLNSLNFNDEEDDTSSDNGGSAFIFFTEANIENGQIDYKGLYSLKGGKATKLLDNGRASATDNGDNKAAYFAASDGIYKYNDKTHTAEKYGTATDSFVAIAKANSSDAIYVINENKQLFRVTEDGTKQIRINDVPAAEQIVLDFNDNLYYIGTDKQAYIVNENGTKKIEGLPANPTFVKLIKAPFIIEDGVPLIVNNNSYIIYSNGTSTVTQYVIKEKPTAYGMEASLIIYFAYDKNIYEYNILAMLFGTFIEALKDIVDENKDFIQSLATKSRSHNLFLLR